MLPSNSKIVIVRHCDLLVVNNNTKKRRPVFLSSGDGTIQISNYVVGHLVRSLLRRVHSDKDIT